MKKLITLAIVVVIALSMSITEEAQAFYFLPDSCVENGSRIDNMRCLWYLQIAMLMSGDYYDYTMATPNDPPTEVKDPTTQENILTKPAYGVKSGPMIIWYPIRA